jgi:hypothetical protein
MKAIVIQLPRKLPVLAAATLLLVAQPVPVPAMSCFADLGNCYYSAAAIDGFWQRWSAGLDCEVSFIRCARQDILGF